VFIAVLDLILSQINTHPQRLLKINFDTISYTGLSDEKVVVRFPSEAKVIFFSETNTPMIKPFSSL